MCIGRAFLTMHRILDKENQIHTDMALALPAVVKDAVAIWADMMHWIGVPADRSVNTVSFGYRSSNGSNAEMPKSCLPEMLFFSKASQPS